MNCWNAQILPPIKTEPRGKFTLLRIQTPIFYLLVNIQK